MHSGRCGNRGGEVRRRELCERHDRLAGKDESAAEAGKTQTAGVRPVERCFHSSSGCAAWTPPGRSQGVCCYGKRRRCVENSQTWNSGLFWALDSQSGQLSKQLSSSKRGR